MEDRLLVFENLRIGDSWTSNSREMTSGEIREFADLTGDFTRIHLDEAYAADSPFKAPIAHGLLGLSVLAGLSSVAPTVHTTALLSIQSWQFRKPIFVGDEIHAVTQVTALHERGRRHGEVEWYRKLVNQRSEIVQDGIFTTLVERQALVSARQLKRMRVDNAGHLPVPHSVNDATAKSSLPANLE